LISDNDLKNMKKGIAAASGGAAGAAAAAAADGKGKGIIPGTSY
jgi:hypothetical protein